MLWVNFLLTNMHFAITLFGFVTCLILVYIFFSSYNSGKSLHLLLRAFGFGTLAVYLGIHARSSGELNIEDTLQILRFAGLLLITISFYMEPLQKVPSASLLIGGIMPAVGKILGVLSFITTIALIIRIYRKYSAGLERELKNLHRGFVLYFLFELFHAVGFLKSSQNVFLAKLAGDFGFFWILSHLFLLAAFVFLLKYSWGYIRFELFSQIFGAFVIAALFIFIFTASTYTFLLIRQMQKNAEEGLRVDLASFNYSINNLRERAISTAKVIAVDDSIAKSLDDEDLLQSSVDKAMISSGVDFLVITDKDGKILSRDGGYQSTGASMSGNYVVSGALAGQQKTNLATREWVNAPIALIEGAVPTSYGAIYTGYILDSAFVDGYKDATGLETSIYGGSVKSATTYVAPDGVSRLVGAKETSPTVQSEVLDKGNTYLGLSNVFGSEYVSAYGPFKSEEDKILGMVFVGFSSNILFEAARNSINTTFYVTVFLAVASFLPAYFFAKFVEKHQA